MNRRTAISAIAGGAAAWQAPVQQRRRRRPNFLFLVADDHAGYVMGCAGNREVSTPHLDRLAGEGTRFARHFCNSPVCTPSRQSFFTGQMPHMAGVTTLRTPLAEDKPTLAKAFRAAGYRTGAIGKMHFNRPAAPLLHGFDYPLCDGALQQEWRRKVKPRPVPAGVRVKPPWRPFQDPASIWLNSEALPFPRHDEDMRGTYMTRLARQFCEENQDRPFALWVSFNEPHSPFDFPVEDYQRFSADRLSAPRIGPEDAWQIPLIFRELSEEQRRGIMAAYYASVWHLDKNIGAVLRSLAELRLEEDTLVVYMPDHGYCLGHHGRFEKHCGYDPAMHVPLIVRFPGRVRRGVVEDLTESADITPTILELMELDPLPLLHGQSLVPYLKTGRHPAGRDHVFSEYLENEEVFIRTREWKYIYCSGKRERLDGYKTDNPTPGRYERLYHLASDPGEFTDVAPKQPDQVKRFRRLALNRFRQTHPEADREPVGRSVEEALEYYLPPRDQGSGA